MIKAILPSTNHKPHWVELHIDGQYAARVWAHSVEVLVEKSVSQFNVIVSGEDGGTQAFLWADAIEQAKE